MVSRTVALLLLFAVVASAKPFFWRKFGRYGYKANEKPYVPLGEGVYLGKLPQRGNTSISYGYCNLDIPDTAKWLLVYIWATTEGDKAFDRYYYEISTTDGTTVYPQYMNTAASVDVSLNSADLWLPAFKGTDCDITITLHGPEGPNNNTPPPEEVIKYGEIFVLGYK